MEKIYFPNLKTIQTEQKMVVSSSYTTVLLENLMLFSPNCVHALYILEIFLVITFFPTLHMSQ